MIRIAAKHEIILRLHNKKLSGPASVDFLQGRKHVLLSKLFSKPIYVKRIGETTINANQLSNEHLIKSNMFGWKTNKFEGGHVKNLEYKKLDRITLEPNEIRTYRIVFSLE
eukprot:TRINITY_DN1018_c0_g1_i7.p1 TRINITY_DN1018_c0_g1~~TRINITY_DN1018_c0_g1_i7.p1  ORF type:complete len:111 (+),score=15.82 TRINITY_DN1018_c0_g1_i7:209-541(+)